MTDIIKIANVSSSNYEVNSSRETNPKNAIRYIVIAMTNNLHSGYAYSNLYKNPLTAPKFSYNYVIDKNGRIYNTIDDKYVPFSVKSSTSDNRSENTDVLSICMMPTWDGDSYGDEYEKGSKFPEDPETNQYFILTKARTISGESYPVGLYQYDGVDWILQEELTDIDVKRPMNSENWSFERATEESAIYLVKWLQRKYEITDTRVVRVYDFYKTYNPSPYIKDNSELWDNFKYELGGLESVPVEYCIVPETQTPIDEEIKKAHPESTVEELIEKYGPNAVGEKKEFTGNSIVDITKGYDRNFTFRIGIHDTLQNNVNGEIATTTGNLWDIKNATEKCEWTTYLDSTVDEFSFTYRDRKKEIKLEEGFNVGYWINEIAGFNGNITEIKQKLSDKELHDVRALGWLRYLMCDGYKCFTNRTASQIFDEICTMLNIPHRVITPSNHICIARNYAGASWYSMIKDAIDDTLASTGEWYIIQPNFGELTFRNILDSEPHKIESIVGNMDLGSNIKSVIFSEKSCIIDGDYQTDINDSYNVVIGYISGEKNDDGSTQIAAMASAKDESTIQKWGMLTKLEEFKENNMVSLTKYVQDRLKFWNSPRRRLSLKCIGVPGIIAGNIIWVEIYDLDSVGNVAGGVVVDKCTHRIENGKHTMDLEIELVQDGTLQTIIYNSVKKEE